MAVSVSLKKLAEILGLAPSTVSRALKGHPDISRATQESGNGTNGVEVPQMRQRD